MTLLEALDAVFRDNEHATRTSWNNRKAHVSLEDGRLCIYGEMKDNRWTDDGMYHPLILTENDFFATDWVIVDNT